MKLRPRHGVALAGLALAGCAQWPAPTPAEAHVPVASHAAVPPYRPSPPSPGALPWRDPVQEQTAFATVTLAAPDQAHRLAFDRLSVPGQAPTGHPIGQPAPPLHSSVPEQPEPGRVLVGAVVGAALARQLAPDAQRPMAGAVGALGGAVLAAGPCLAPPGVLTWWGAGLGALGARVAARSKLRSADLAAGFLAGAILGSSIDLACER